MYGNSRRIEDGCNKKVDLHAKLLFRITALSKWIGDILYSRGSMVTTTELRNVNVRLISYLPLIVKW